MLQKLLLSRRAWRPSHAGKLIHRGIADLTVDGLAVVQHRKSVRQSFVVIPNDATTRQRHHNVLLAAPPNLLHATNLSGRWRVRMEPICSPRDRDAPDRSTAPSPASPPARCRD